VGVRAVRRVFFPSFPSEPASAPAGVAPRPGPSPAPPRGVEATQPAIPPAEIAAVRERARAEGFEAGREEGRALAHADWSARLADLATSLEAAGRALLARRVDLAADVDRQLPRLVLALARKVLHGELQTTDTALRTVIRGVSERLSGCDRPVALRVGPGAVEAVEAWRQASGAEPSPLARVRVEPDWSLDPGEWVLETADGFLDGRVESQIEEAWKLVTELRQ